MADSSNNHEGMENYMLRLSTFNKFPRSVDISSIELTAAGFYYTGEADEVQCHKCHLKLKDWGPGLKPMDVHKNFSPSCIFINNNLSDEKQHVNRNRESIVPLIEKLSNLSTVPRSIDSGFNGGSSGSYLPPSHSFNNYAPSSTDDSEFAQDPQHSASHQFTYSGGPSLTPALNAPNNSQRSANLFSVPPSMRKQTEDHLNLNHDTRLFSQQQGSSTSFPQTEDHESTDDYKYEQNRLASFHNWSDTAVLPTDLAKSGFFYLGTEDKVQCVFCKGILSHWEPNDNPDAEHKKHFGLCSFLNNPFSVGNVPVNEANVTSQESEVSLGNEGILLENPVHQMYTLPQDRLATFKDFPQNLTQTPKQFVSAGFFYSGIADNVKCFFCDGGLRNWDPEDEPWKEHARWFPRCAYLRMIKGEKYVKEVQTHYAPAAQQVVNPPPPVPRNTSKKFPVNSRKVQDYLRSRTACAVLDMGYDENLVKQVVIRRMEDLGDELFPNAESLLDAIIEYEVEMKQNDHRADTKQSDEIKDATQKSDDFSAPSPEPKKKNKKKKNKKKKADESDPTVEQAQSNTGSEKVVGNTAPLQYVNNVEAKKLSEDVQRMKDERMCKICMDEEVNIVFLRCGHLVCCSTCAPAMRHCPICRDTIRGTVKVFLS